MWSTCSRSGLLDPRGPELSRRTELPAVRSCLRAAGRVPNPEGTRAKAAPGGSSCTWTHTRAPPRFGPEVWSPTPVPHAGAGQEWPLTAPRSGTLSTPKSALPKSVASSPHGASDKKPPLPKPSCTPPFLQRGGLTVTFPSLPPLSFLKSPAQSGTLGSLGECACPLARWIHSFLFSLRQ